MSTRKKPSNKAAKAKHKAVEEPVSEEAALQARFDQLQAEAEQHAAFLVEHYRKTAPHIHESLGLLELLLSKTCTDVITLQFNAESTGQDVDFWQLFRSSTFQNDFFTALWQVAHSKPNLDEAKPLVQRGFDDLASQTIYGVRNMLRDGHSFEDAMQRYGTDIGQCLSKGDVWLISVLEAARKKPPRRSTHNWIRRAWLPMALWWKDDSPKRVAKFNYEALKLAYEAMKNQGAELITFPGRAELTKAIATVASRLRKGRS